MGLRYRKSVKIGPVRLNASKSGLGWSVGGKGFRYTKKAGGGTRTTTSLPGTGLSWVKDSPSNKKKVSKPVMNSQIKAPDKVAPKPIQKFEVHSPYPKKLTKHAMISVTAFVVLLIPFFFAPVVLFFPFMIVTIYHLTTLIRMAIYKSKHKDEVAKYFADLKLQEAKAKKEAVESPRLIENEETPTVISEPDQIENTPETASSTPAASVADELLKLKSLLDAGVLTQAEFDTQKAKILDN